MSRETTQCQSGCSLLPKDMLVLQRPLWQSFLFAVVPSDQRRSNVYVPPSEHGVFTRVLEDPNCEICKVTKTTRARCKTKPEKRADSLPHVKAFGELSTADHTTLHLECESRVRHRNAPNIQDLFSFWLQSYPVKNKNDMPATVKPGDDLHRKFVGVRRSLCRTGWDSRHFYTSARSDRWNCRWSCSSSQRETAAAFVPCGLSEEPRYEATDCCCQLRNTFDTMVDVKTVSQKRFNALLKGPVMPFGVKVACKPFAPTKTFVMP